MIRKSKPGSSLIDISPVRRRDVLSESVIEELSEVRTEEQGEVELNEKKFLPSSYTPGRFQPYMIDEIERLARFGKTNEEIAVQWYGVSLTTWYKWMKLYPELQAALYRGRDEAGMKIVDSLYKQALGYEVEERQKEYYYNKDGEKKLKTERVVKKQVLPSSKAGMWLLKVRNPNKWTEVRQVESKSTIDVNVNKKLDFSDMSFEDLMFMKKLGMKAVPEAFHSQGDKLKTIKLNSEDVA